MVINSCTSPASSGGPGMLPLHGMEQHVPGLTMSLEPASFPSSLYQGEASSSSSPLTSDRQLVDLDRQNMEASLCPRGMTDHIADDVLSHDPRHLHHRHLLQQQQQQQQQQQLALHQQDVDATTTHQQPEFCRVVPHLGHPEEQVLPGPGEHFLGIMPASISLPGNVDCLGDGGPAIASLPVSSPCSSSPSSMSSSSSYSSSAPSPLTHGSLYSPLCGQYRPPPYGQPSHPHLPPLHNPSLYPGYDPHHTLPPPPPLPSSPSTHLGLPCYDVGLYPADSGSYDGQGFGQGTCSFPYHSQPLGGPGFLGGSSGMGGSQTGGGGGGGGLLGGRGCGRGLDSVKKKERVRRPMNSFMVWSKNERKRLAKELPACNNSDLSRELGRIWKSMSQTEKQPFSERAMELAEEHKQKYPDYKYKPRRRPKESKKANRRNKKLQQQQQQQEQQLQQLRQGDGAEYPLTAFHDGFVDSLEEEASKDSMLSADGLKNHSFGLCTSGNREVYSKSNFNHDTAMDDREARAGKEEGLNKDIAEDTGTIDNRGLAIDLAATPCVSSPAAQFTTSRSSLSSSPLSGSVGVKRESQASLEGVDPVASAPLLSDLLHTPPYSPDATKPNVLEFHHLRLQAGGHVLSVAGRVTSPSLASTARPGVDPSSLSPSKRKADSESSRLFEKLTSAPRQPQLGKRPRPNTKTSRSSKSIANLTSFPSGERDTSPFGGMPTPDGSPLFSSACDQGHLRSNPDKQRYGPHSQLASFTCWSGGSGPCADYGGGVGGPRREAQTWDSMSSPLPTPLASPYIKSLLQQPPTVLAAQAHSQSCVTFGDRQSAVVSATSTVYSSYLPALRRAHFGERLAGGDSLPIQPLNGGHTALPSYMPDSTSNDPAATMEQTLAGPSGWSTPSDCDHGVSLGGEACALQGNAFGGAKTAVSEGLNGRLGSRNSGGSFDNSGVLPAQPQPQPHHYLQQRGSEQEEELSSLQQVFGLDKLDDFDSSELDCYLRVNQPDMVPPSSTAHDLSRSYPTFQKRRWAMGDSRILGDIYTNFSQQLTYSTNHPRGDDMHFPPSAATRRLTYSPCDVDSKLAYVSHRNVGSRLNCSPCSTYSDSEGSVVRASYSSSSSPDYQHLQNSGESFYDLDKQMAVVSSYTRL